MDYIIEEKEKQLLLIEQKKNNIKDRIIGEYVSLRKAKGLSQEDIANLTGIARPNISRTENGKYDPTLEVLTKLAFALDMELEIKFIKKGENFDR